MQDYFHDHVNTANGGNRVATVLTYLDDVGEGGETVGCGAKLPGALENHVMSKRLFGTGRN